MSFFKKVIFRIKTKLYSGNRRAELYRPYLYNLGNNCEFYTTNLGSELYLLNFHSHVILACNCNLITHDYSSAIVSKIIGKNIGKIGPIEIEDNVFIGANATIMPNVKIGKNSIVAAGSVVTKNIPPNEVLGGVPAKRIMSIAEYSEKIVNLNNEYPWKKNGKNDSIEERQKFFWGEIHTKKVPF